MESEDFGFSAEYNTLRGTFCLSYRDEKGNEKKKSVSVPDFLQLLNNSRRVCTMVPIQKTPEDFVAGSIARESFSGTAAFVWKAHKDLFCYHEGFRNNGAVLQQIIPWPNLLSVVKFEDHRMVTLWVYAYEGELGPETPLRKLPLSNVYDDGHICMGSNQISADSLIELNERVRAAFFASPFNSDLFVAHLEQQTIEKRFSDIREHGFVVAEMTPVTTLSQLHL